MATRWRRNDAGCASVARSQAAQRQVAKTARAVARQANLNDPPTDARTIIRSDGGDAKTDPQKRAYASTRGRPGPSGADAKVYGGPGQHIIEFGSVNNPPYAPLRRALRTLGLEVKP